MRARYLRLFLLLAGCAGGSNDAERVYYQAVHDCKYVMGFPEGTPEYGQCVMQGRAHAHQIDMHQREARQRAWDNLTPIQTPQPAPDELHVTAPDGRLSSDRL
jgi:hypothetical protein